MGWVAEAAFVGASLQAAHHLYTTLDIDMMASSEPAGESFRSAVASLETRFGVAVWEVLEMQPVDATTAQVKKAQKTISDAIMDFVFTRWYPRLPDLVKRL